MKSGIIFVTSAPMSVLAFILPHIRNLNEFIPVQVIANSKKRNLLRQRGVDVPIDFVPIVRPIKPISDIKALWILYWQFKKHRPLAVHTITPKAGLLGMLAAWLTRVPVRIHSFTGQVWVKRTGFMRWLLKAADKLIVATATDVLVDSPSQQDYLVKQGILLAGQSKVLGSGSICGVNTKVFLPNKNVREEVRKQLGTTSDAIVCLYLGRLHPDKGVLDLAVAFGQVADRHPKVELWVVGPDEGDVFQEMRKLTGKAVGRVKRLDYTPTPERFMKASDLFCLPSYREGFGSSVIEAAACGVPTLASRIYGLTDAVVEGQTGWLHKPGDIQDLSEQLDRLFANPIELTSTGVVARQYATTYFSEKILVEAMKDLYKRKINQDQNN